MSTTTAVSESTGFQGYGDASIFLDQPQARRVDFANRNGLKFTVFPGDIVQKNDPGAPLHFKWVDKADRDMIDEATEEEGYKFVEESDFTARRWRWDQGKLCWGTSMVMMYAPLSRYEEIRLDSVRMNQQRLNEETEKVHEQMAQAGVESFEIKNGRTLVGNAGKKRR